jgi:peptidoglycan/xylan/chitin deacetylase (PgdA/CDA1 family)
MWNIVLPIALTLPLLQAASSPAQPARRVAITIDDGPVVGEMSDVDRFQQISNGLIGSLAAERVPATIFINERQLNVPGQRDARAAVLEQWLAAGFDLANHTYSHPSLNQIPLWQYADEVVKGEVIMRPLVERRGRKLEWFRYPFLHSGTTEEAHEGILEFLARRGYRVAPVTVDYADYTFAGMFRNQRAAGNDEAAERIKHAYLEQVDLGFDYAEKASVELWGREIPQILLIHCNELNALTLRDTVARLRQRGYTFIPLAEAMADAAYARPDTFTGPGGSWLSRTATAMGRRLTTTRPPIPAWITQPPAPSRPAAPASEAPKSSAVRTLPAVKRLGSPKAVVDEHLAAINACDWQRLMAQYPPEVQFFLPGGQVVKGREAVGELFRNFVKPVKEGGLCGLKFTSDHVFAVGDTINVQWTATGDFLAEPYKGADAYETKDGLMWAQVTTFDGAQIKLKK